MRLDSFEMDSVVFPPPGQISNLVSSISGAFSSLKGDRNMFEFFSYVVDYFAPLFLIASPVTSYADQILSIHRSKSSDGFALDIPLIMLVASILKVFYWFGEYYDTSLLVQACLMIIMQTILLKVALDNRAPSIVQHRPFSAYTADSVLEDLMAGKRPFNFWRWNTAKPYFQFLAYMTATLLFIHVLLPFISRTAFYITLLGYVGLAIEAFLPIPQILKNHNARSCKGFRLSVIINWLAGDTMKMSYFFLSKEVVPWPFKLCGIFQACCDVYLGLQFYMYGEGPQYRQMEVGEITKGSRMSYFDHTVDTETISIPLSDANSTGKSNF